MSIDCVRRQRGASEVRVILDNGRLRMTSANGDVLYQVDGVSPAEWKTLFYGIEALVVGLETEDAH